MEIFDVWDVIKVPFPYTSGPVRQLRPALVVAQTGGGDAPALLWVVVITSADHRRWNGDIDISDLEAAGLPAPSIVRTAKIATIEADRATRLGQLPWSDRLAVHDRIAVALTGLFRTGLG